jgi:hypothetical protein
LSVPLLIALRILNQCSKISPDDTLNKTDFASAQMGSLATGGIRPGEFQLDPNAKPGAYLSTRLIDPLSPAHPNPVGLNATVLNGLSAMTTTNTYIDPILLDLSGQGVKMTGIEDGVMFDVDHSAGAQSAPAIRPDVSMIASRGEMRIDFGQVGLDEIDEWAGDLV